MTEKNMIGGDGSLSISGDMVTWFNFLAISRIFNSDVGGWNNKSFWSDLGLASLCPASGPADFLSKWTESSLHSDALPIPRDRDFQFSKRQNDLKKGERGRGGTPKAGSENAINWGLSLNLKNTGGYFSYEVPLADTSKGQLKVDLMLFRDQGKVEIIELKKGDGTDTPLMALTEAICYGIQTVRCWPTLRKNAKKQFNQDFGELSAVNLILASPEEYWTQWNPGNKSITNEQIKKLSEIVINVAKVLSTHGGPPAEKLTLSMANVIEAGKIKDKRGNAHQLYKLERFIPSPDPPEWSVLTQDGSSAGGM